MRNDFSVGRKISNCFAWVWLAAALAVLAGCGGAGTTSSGTSSTPGVPTASTVQLLVGNPQILSSGSTPVDLTAVVLGSTGQTVSGRTVTFSTQGDSTAFVNNISGSGVADANGLVTAKLNLGSNKTNRTISVSASVDGAHTTVSVDVTGTTIAISGSSSLSFNATTTLSIIVKDSAGTPLRNATVTVASQTGNTIVLSPTSGITNSSGQISATVTATKTGNDVITASAAGTSKTQALTISNATFGFTTPAAAAQIPLNTATPVAINWTNGGAPVVGQAVSFSSSRGAIASSSITDSAGNTPGVTISSSSAGPAIISAAGPGGTPAATLNVVFVATSASTVTPQATPNIVQPTTTSTSQTNNTSTISAVVRDAAGNLVQSARVNFTITADPSGGSLSASTAVTDASGSASVSYVAGGATSPQNGVVISATVSDINGVPLSPVVGPTRATLTVGGQALFVRLGADNTVGATGVTYNKTYVAIVTDSAGNAVPTGTSVRFSIRPNRYAKGFFIFTDPLWTHAPTPTFCPNEDLNFNGILDPGEDINGNGRLDPGNVASVNTSATTDANGLATATINYAKDFATWVEVVLEARAGVVGNDPPATATFFLPGQAKDYSDKTVPPPGATSPFGAGVAPNNICTNAL